jgi:hypothetical protein
MIRTVAGICLIVCASALSNLGAGENKTFKGAGVAFDYPDGYTVNEQPRKDGQGSTLVATNGTYSRTVYIRTYVGTFDAQAALTETQHREAVISGIPLSKWGESKRKIAGEERSGFKADFAEVAVETYVFKLGEKLVSVTLSRRSKDGEETDAIYSTVINSLKPEAK